MSFIRKYLNQKEYKIMPKPEMIDGLFVQVNLGDLDYAEQNLTHTGLLCWLRLAKNANNFSYIWSSARLAQELGETVT